MAILTGPEIQRQIDAGNIVIDPFDPAQLNPNSYDVRLGDTLLTYAIPIYSASGASSLSWMGTLDPRKDNPTTEIKIPSDGLILYPRTLYLGSTLEHTETRGYVPMLEGKSSLARLGLSVHVTAGFGDVGFCGPWTLELTVVHHTRIYAGMKIAQICYHTIEGDIVPYAGKYQRQRGPVASRSWMDAGE